MTQDEEVVAEETGHMETHDEVYEEVEEVVEVVEVHEEEDADAIGLRHTHDVLRVFADMVQLRSDADCVLSMLGAGC